MSSYKPTKLSPGVDYGMQPAHRHITTIDAHGRSVFAPEQDILYCDRGGYAVSWTYATSEFPADLRSNADLRGYLSEDDSNKNSVLNTGARIVHENGIVFNTTNFAPGTETVMHRTVSLDFVAVVEGEIELELDSGDKVLLKPGDSIVQRQTSHLWRNTSKDKPARMISMISPARAMTVEGKEIGQQGFDIHAMGKMQTA